MKFYKYQGAGNDFLLADNRKGAIREQDGVLYAADGGAWSCSIEDLCNRRYGVGADGLMLLEKAPEGSAYDFTMNYFNSDGSGGMMCGNGGRCIVAFAADLGIRTFEFMAADGPHSAQILATAASEKVVRLKMKDVIEVSEYDSLSGVTAPSSGYFLDTGTRHFVRFVDDVESYDVLSEGRDIRFNAVELLPLGTNVNFVQHHSGGLKVRTYEKGVEDETYACGTGVVASCIAAYVSGKEPSDIAIPDGRVRYDVKAKRDALSVDFIPSDVVAASDVWLTGPAVYVAEINV